jgi:hypothetical protein
MEKKNLLSLLLLGLFAFASCKKDTTKNNDTGGVDTGEYGNHPRSTVPASLAAQWVYGSFSLSSVVNNNGTWSSEYSLTYVLETNGTCREYFQYSSMPSYGMLIQVRGLRKGTVVVDAANKTIKFYAAAGWYDERRNLGSVVRHEYASADLYPHYFREYSYTETTDGQGRPALRLVDVKSTNTAGLVYTRS